MGAGMVSERATHLGRRSNCRQQYYFSILLYAMSLLAPERKRNKCQCQVNHIKEAILIS